MFLEKMRYHKKSNRLFFYIFISLMIHLGVFLYFSFDSLSIMGGNTKNRDFSYIQFVEYKPTSESAKTSRSIKEDIKAVKKPETNKKNEMTEKKPKPIKKKDVEPKVKKQTKELKPQSKVKPISESKPKVENKPILNSKPQSKTKPSVQSKQNEITKGSNVNEKAKEIISSEDSNLKIKVKNEKKAKEKVKPIQKQEKSEPKTDKIKIDSYAKSKSESQPALPPTAGDLISLAPKPCYPKDLVAEAMPGIVDLIVHISPKGQVDRVEIINSSGIEQMDKTAILTIKRGWKFNSYKKSYSLELKIEYKIDKNGNSQVNVKQGKLTFK